MNQVIKNYTKKAIVGLLLICFHEATMAENTQEYQLSDDITFDSRISVGTQSMVANEYLYNSIENHTNSKLIWDTKSLTMVGIGASLHFQEMYTFNIDYWFSINDANSKMTDYDWMIIGYDGKNDWTHRSIHKDTDVSSASSFDISAEFNTYQLSTTILSTLIGYRQDTAKRKAYGGEFIYSVEEFRDATGNFPNGKLGISYEQTWKSTYLGFKTYTPITNVLTLHTKFIYAPFVKGKTTDTHHLRDIIGKSTLDNTNMYAINLGLGYKISNSLTLNLNYMYQKYDTTDGDMKWKERGEVYYLKNFSIADLKTSLFSISLDYKF